MDHIIHHLLFFLSINLFAFFHKNLILLIFSTIILNIYFSKEQKRYTIAYLISSYLIFYNNEKFLGSHFLGSHVFDNEIEEVAAFARMLLIPDNKLKASISKDCETLAYFFKVPVEVMDKRLKEVYKKDKILQRKKD